MEILNIIQKSDKNILNIFNRIFEIREVNLNLIKFNKFPDFQKQNIIFIKDKILETEAIFNTIRKKRPQPQISPEQQNNKENDPFCNYNDLTPIDEIGRLENESAITAANLAKMADYHSLIIFKKHEFKDINKDDFKNAITLTQKWFKKIKELDSQATTFILIWNYHYRAAASILHPHFQVLAYKDIPQKILFWYRKFEEYQKEFKSEYLNDYFKIAQYLKISKNLENLKVWFSLTPFKEKTLFLNGQGLENFWQVLTNLITTGTQSFNIFYIYSSPLIKNFGFFVDRGEINKPNSDFGALEIFGLPVIAYDPLEISKLIFG